MKRIPRSHRLHNFCAIVASAILIVAQTCLAFDPNEWRNTQTLDIPVAGLVHVNLPATTLDAAQPGLEDLRIVDSKGDQVPYLIERLLPDPESTIRPTEFRSTIENGATHLILKTGTSAPIIGVSLETPATRFMKAADVEGSNDGRTWIKLAGGDSLFQLPNGATKLRVSFPEGAWQFLRITIDDLGSPPGPFTGARLHKARTTAPAEAVAATIKSRGESDFGISADREQRTGIHARCYPSGTRGWRRRYSRAQHRRRGDLSSECERQKRIAPGDSARIPNPHARVVGVDSKRR